MRLNEQIKQAIERGLAFLAGSQLSNGEFRCYISNNDHMIGFNQPSPVWCIPDSVVFSTVLVGNSLLCLRDNIAAEQILRNIVTFLEEQKGPGSTWKHYTKNHKLYEVSPYDLDDTACASSFLKAMQVPFEPNRALILANMANHKMYFTWIALRFKLNFNLLYWRLILNEFKMPVNIKLFWSKFSCSRYDIDAVVNANVLFYMGFTGNTEDLSNYLTEVLIQSREADCDKWYRNIFTVYYFFSRLYKAGLIPGNSFKQLIINKVCNSLNTSGGFGNSVLDTALAVCSNLNLNSKNIRPELILHLLDNQTDNGSWVKRRYYYSGPAQDVGWGSEELTTAVCLEALQGYNATFIC